MTPLLLSELYIQLNWKRAACRSGPDRQTEKLHRRDRTILVDCAGGSESHMSAGLAKTDEELFRGCHKAMGVVVPASNFARYLILAFKAERPHIGRSQSWDDYSMIRRPASELLKASLPTALRASGPP
jgi:hypothetical protein